MLVSSGSGNHVALFSYYLVLNGAVLGVAWVRAWRELNIIGFVFTFGIGALWGYEAYTPGKFASTEPFLVAHFLFYTVIAILFAFRSRPKLRGYVDGTLVFGTPTIAFALQSLMLHDNKFGLALSAVAIAVFYAALAVWLRRRQDENFDLLQQSFTALSVAFGTVAVPLALDDRWTAIAWALEGTALVWIGVRQNGTLARLTGAALAFAGGVMFLDHGWLSNTGMPILNANVAGGLLIALASLSSARLLNTDSKPQNWHLGVEWLLLLWGVTWWFGVGYTEVDDQFSGDMEKHAWLVFASLSVILMTLGARHLQWSRLQAPAFLFLPMLHIAVVFYLLRQDHFLGGWGWLAWPAALLAHGVFLRMNATGYTRLVSVWHGWGGVFVVGLIAYEIGWQIDQHAINDIWAFTGAMAALGAGSWLFATQQNSQRWPFTTHSNAYLVAAMTMSTAYMFFTFILSVNEPGDPAPLPYIPLFNPFDLLSAGGLVLTWVILGISGARERWNSSRHAPGADAVGHKCIRTLDTCSDACRASSRGRALGRW